MVENIYSQRLASSAEFGDSRPIVGSCQTDSQFQTNSGSISGEMFSAGGADSTFHASGLMAMGKSEEEKASAKNHPSVLTQTNCYEGSSLFPDITNNYEILDESYVSYLYKEYKARKKSQGGSYFFRVINEDYYKTKKNLAATIFIKEFARMVEHKLSKAEDFEFGDSGDGRIAFIRREVDFQWSISEADGLEMLQLIRDILKDLEKIKIKMDARVIIEFDSTCIAKADKGYMLVNWDRVEKPLFEQESSSLSHEMYFLGKTILELRKVDVKPIVTANDAKIHNDNVEKLVSELKLSPQIEKLLINFMDIEGKKQPSYKSVIDDDNDDLKKKGITTVTSEILEGSEILEPTDSE